MTTADRSPATGDDVLRLLRAGSDLCRKTRRPDLAEALEIAAARVRRPSTIVCIVGEYKQGKSNVINALVGTDICVVDDDLATASITVIGNGSEPAAVVHRSTNGEQVTERIAIEDLPAFTVESHEGSFPQGVDLVEVVLPGPLLENGLTIVDTPGVNSLRPGNERIVLDFLPYVDGLIFVSDASAELSPPERRFLEAARRVCPSVIVALSKIDLYPEWRRIAALDAEHLTPLGMRNSIVPISSVLERDAWAIADGDLHNESGFPELVETLQSDVLDRARQLAATRGLQELRSVLSTVRTTQQAALSALEDPAAAEQRLIELRKAEAAAARLRAASAKWTIALNDGIADLRSSVDYELRSAIRRQLQDTDRMVADAEVKAAWDLMVDSVTESLVECTEAIFATVRDGTARLAEQIAAMIAAEVPDLLIADETLDVAAVWSASQRELEVEGPSVISSGLAVLRGGYSGMLMLSMLANVAGIAVLGPVSLGAGALFGAKQFRDERSRQRERQRQEARNVLRQFLDQIQHELAVRSQRAIQDAHRTLRDHFADRIAELSATYAQATRMLEESVAADQERTKQLATVTRGRMKAIDEILSAAESAVVE